jgi:hypothetical protein
LLLKFRLFFVGRCAKNSATTREGIMPKFAFLFALFVVTVSATSFVTPAFAQATRTWVSGVGDDVNPCSRTAPCKTFAGAISKTAPGGEIDALDPGGFGGVTITKAITLDGGGGQNASILVANSPGITVNAGAADKVVIRNLSINGAGSGTNGINFVAGSSLTVEHTYIANFTTACINFQPSVRANLFVVFSNLQNCAGGGIISSAVSSGVNRVNISHSSIEQSGVAFTAGQNTDGVVLSSAIWNNGGGGVLANASTSQVSIDLSTISNNQVFGLHSTNSAIIRLSNSSVAYNNGTGLLADVSGQILTWSNNWVGGNSPDGARTGTITPQ